MSQTQTQTFNTQEDLIEALLSTLLTLGKSQVYINIISDNDQDGAQWSYDHLTEDSMETIREEFREWLPWPKKSNGHSTVAYGDGHTITVTLT
jgi:hypothetical protein